MKFYFLIFFWLILTQCDAQGIIGSDMTKVVSGNLADFILKIYRENEPNPPIIFDWGDGTSDTISGGPGLIAGTNIIATTYYGTHFYDSSGFYEVGYRDSFLVSGISNILNADSQSIFFSDSLFVIPDSLVININSAPGIGGNIKAFIPDDQGAIIHDMFIGQSDQWDFYTCHLVKFPLPGYSFPETTDSLHCDSGLFIWDRPTEEGRYAFALRLRETRQWPGFEDLIISTTTRYVIVDIDSSMLNITQVIPLDFSQDIEVYPNPATDRLNISFEKELLENKIVFTIVNLLGQMIHQESLHLQNKKLARQINISEYPNGTYFLTFKSGEVVMTKKFIISR